MYNARIDAPASRWINVTFLQGDDADEVIAMIDDDGPDAAIRHLSRWDFGDETTEAALVNGYAYDTIPSGSTDRTIVDDDSLYALTYSRPFGYVSLLRRYEAQPEYEPATPRPARAPATGARPKNAAWSLSRTASPNCSRHTVAL